MEPASGEDGPRTAEFETAQRELLEAVDLDVRSRFVDLDAAGGRTHVFEAGPSDDDVPLVFVHGTAGFGAVLAPLVARFDDRRTVAFDRPGYGLSEPFVYTAANLRRTVLDVLAGVLDALGLDRVDLVGHSMGGHASLRFALVHPDRVRRLSLVGAVPGFPGTRPPLPLRLLTVPVLGRVVQRLQKSGEEGVLDVAEIFGEGDVIRDHPAFVRALAAHEAIPRAAEAGASEFAALFSIRGWHASARIGRDELRRLEHPTTLVWGTRDPLGGPDDVREGVASIPDARFESVDTGHFPYLSRAEQCARLVRP